MLKGKTVRESFFSSEGDGQERLRMIVNKEAGAGIIKYDEKGTMRLISAVTTDGLTVDMHYDRNGKLVESSFTD